MTSKYNLKKKLGKIEVQIGKAQSLASSNSSEVREETLSFKRSSSFWKIPCHTW